jgi:hypothetical protein
MVFLLVLPGICPRHNERVLSPEERSIGRSRILTRPMGAIFPNNSEHFMEGRQVLLTEGGYVVRKWFGDRKAVPHLTERHF